MSEIALHLSLFSTENINDVSHIQYINQTFKFKFIYFTAIDKKDVSAMGSLAEDKRYDEMRKRLNSFTMLSLLRFVAVVAVLF